VLDETTLAMNLLSFRAKSFGFERTLEVDGESYALFQRTETESESKLRPKLLRLWVAVPLAWLIYDEATESLVLGRDGEHPGPAGRGSAQEAAGEAPVFDEQGIRWHRRPIAGDRIVYLPEERVPALGSAARLAEIAGPGEER
jgi:hypothetical protein